MDTVRVTEEQEGTETVRMRVDPRERTLRESDLVGTSLLMSRSKE